MPRNLSTVPKVVGLGLRKEARRERLGGVLLATAVLLGLGASAPSLALPKANTIEFSNCTLAMPGTSLTATARCGFLEVPEDPEDPQGRQISIHVAIGEATGTDTAADPVFFLAGGPGQAASETWVMMRNILHKIRKRRDIVMIDQRGTGQSNKLQCEALDTADLLNQEVDLDLLARETRRCLEGLDADTRLYTTTIAMQDYNLVREAMGYDQVNLVGVSYGTRAAQVYLRHFPETVRTITLDSVVPMQLALGQEHALRLDQAVQAVLEDCAEDETCSELFPSRANQLNELVTRLREDPRTITITDPTTGEDVELLLSADSLAVAIRFLSYSSESQAVLPLLLHEAMSTGRLDRLATQAMLVVSGLSEAIARGMELSVMCAEDYPFLDFDTDYSQTLMGNLLLEGVKTQCTVWNSGAVPADFHEPVQSAVPALLLSGERDPVTPPQYAALVAQTFPHHLNVVARGQSHSVLRNVCLQEITTRFIDEGSVDGLEIACVDAIRPAPFFTSLLGPEP
jgi:pimeloyl-ACP methyl ester carboxylesterase